MTRDELGTLPSVAMLDSAPTLRDSSVKTLWHD